MNKNWDKSYRKKGFALEFFVVLSFEIYTEFWDFSQKFQIQFQVHSIQARPQGLSPKKNVSWVYMRQLNVKVRKKMRNFGLNLNKSNQSWQRFFNFLWKFHSIPGFQILILLLVSLFKAETFHTKLIAQDYFFFQFGCKPINKLFAYLGDYLILKQTKVKTLNVAETKSKSFWIDVD